MKLPAILLTFSMLVSCAATPSRKVYDRTLMSVVKISHQADADASQTSYCTGFIIDAARGWVLTVRHCVPNNPDTIIWMNESIPVTVERAGDWLALLKTPVMLGPPLELAKDVELFDDVLAIGYGFNAMKVLERHVAGFEDDDIIVDGPLVPGMSGGPIINDKGQVVAINQASAAGVGAGCGYKEIRKFLAQKD